MSTPGGGPREPEDDEPVRDATAGPQPDAPAADPAADPTAPAPDRWGRAPDAGDAERAAGTPPAADAAGAGRPPGRDAGAGGPDETGPPAVPPPAPRPQAEPVPSWPPPGEQRPWPPPGDRTAWAAPGAQAPWPPPGAPPPWAPPGSGPPPGASPPPPAPHTAWPPPAGTGPWPPAAGPPTAPYPTGPGGYGPAPRGPTAYGPGAGGWGAPPPRRRGRIAALVVAGVVLLGVVGIGVLLLVQRPAPVSTAEFQTIRTDVLTYGVPQDWVVVTVNSPPVLGAEFTGTAAAAAYECDGRRFLRGVVTSTLAPQQGPPAGIAATFARALGMAYYGSSADLPPEVTLSDPRTVDLGGAIATRIDATVRTVADDGCLATEGRLIVLAFPLGASGTALLVVNGDAAGGPAAPPSPEPAVLEAIAGTARVNGI